jgi:undecaprenyl pyrophosphate phosphatase UppP
VVLLDRALAILLMLGALGHTLGSVTQYSEQPLVLLWSLCASLYVGLVGVINILRTARPADRALAFIATVATACWMVAGVAFGRIIGNLFDPRVVMFSLICTGLIVLGLKGALRSRDASAANVPVPPRP